jgi:tRNA A-37 threonylcarbamoyl transferase component Bud32
VGKTVGDRYQIDELLGQGGMSAVYKATDPNLRRVVAVKMIHPHLSDNPEFVSRFEEEATAVAQLRHPNIVQVFDFNNDNGIYYMVLEFVPGETLQERLKRLNSVDRRLPILDAARFTIDVCEAADFAHKRGMIHRDIKPANVMLNVQAQAILMDFGIAKIVGGQQHTATGAVIGTALYMSPEQIRGERVDQRTDLYSIGVTLFEMVSGKPPYEADSAMTLMMMHLNDPLPNLRQIHPDVPEDLIAVIEKSLAKDAGNRYQSGAEMASALRQVVDRIESGAGEAATVAEGDRPDDQAPQGEPPIPGTQRVDPGVVGAAAAGGAYAAGYAGSADEAQPDYQQVAPGGTVVVPPTDQAAPPGGGYQGPSATEAYYGEGDRSPNRNIALIGGGAALLVLLLCVVIGGFLIFSQLSDGDEVAAADSTATNTSEPTEVTPSPTVDEATEIAEILNDPTATAELLEVASPPTEIPTLAVSPTPTVPPGIPYVRINDIGLESSYYVVEYETFEYTEQLPGMHVHFFFDTVPPEEAGVPGSGPWKLYGGPRPFKGYTVNNKPAGALQMCALVANSDHSVQPDSGNCYDLPQ